MAKLEGKRKEVKVMSDTCRKRRWEQSDFVAVMLSLASIPDSVIRKVDFSKEHWSIDLKIEM